MAFWNIVKRVIDSCDIIIEVIDARMPELSRNKEIEDKILTREKKLLFVVNKCDLITQREAEKIKKLLKKIAPTLFISSKKHQGTTMLRKEIMRLSKGEEARVGIVGYPNTGKSSLINALKGRQSAKTSPLSGFTTAHQMVRVSKLILLHDTPGVYSYKEKNQAELFLFGALDYTKVKEPDFVAMNLIDNFKDMIKKKYEIQANDTEKILEEIAKKMNKYKKGGILDIDSAARELLRDWQKNKLK